MIEEGRSKRGAGGNVRRRRWGTLIAGLISPRVGSLLFAAWLALLAVRGAWTAIKVTSAVHHS